MVFAIAMAVSIAAAIVITKSKIQRDRRTDVGRIAIAIARIIVGVVSRGIRWPANSTSAQAAGNHQANSKTLQCTHTWNVHVRSPNANLVSF